MPLAAHVKNVRYPSAIMDIKKGNNLINKLLPFCGAGGIRTPSKQGNHMLSTRLFWPSVFELRQDPDHQSQPYPLNFTVMARHTTAISDLPAPLDPQIRNNILGAMSRSANLVAE